MENTSPLENPVSKQEFNGYWIPRHNAKVMKQGLEENKAPFLPDSTGNIKAEPIYNMATGYCLPANRLIPVQFAKMQNGYNSNVVATRTTLGGMENGIKENEKGVFYNFKDEQGEIHTSSLFFAEQTQNPDALIAASKDKIQQACDLVIKEIHVYFFRRADCPGDDILVRVEARFLAGDFPETNHLLDEGMVSRDLPERPVIKIHPAVSYICRVRKVADHRRHDGGRAHSGHLRMLGGFPADALVSFFNGFSDEPDRVFLPAF